MTRGGRKGGRSGRLVVGGGGWLIAVVLGPARPLIGGECLQGAGVRLHVGVSGQCPLGSDVTGADPRRWLILAVVALAQLMVVLDATIVNIALPSAQHALHFSDIERQWVVTAYALAFGSLLLLGGRLTTTFDGTKDRGKAFGVFGAIAGAGGAVGLLLGGLLTQYLDWRWCLYVNLVFAAIAGAGAVVLLRRQPASGRPRLDLPGLAAEAGGMFCIVYGFSNAASDGWHAPATWGFLAAGAVLLTAFGYLETRVRQPLLPPRIVADRNRAASYLSILITGAGMFGIFLFLTYYLQETLGFSPVMAGVAFLPMAGAIIVSANLANIVLLPRTGPRWLVAPGMLAAAAGLAWLTRIGVHASYAADVLPPLLLASAGLGFVMSPSMNTGTSGVAPSDAGAASAMVNTGQQVGGSIGTSLLNTVAASAAASYLASHLSPRLMTGGHPAPALAELA